MSHTILHIDSSPMGDRSTSRKLTARILEKLKAKHPFSKIITRDLGAHPLPHLDAATLNAFNTPSEQRSFAVAEAAKLSDQAIEEIMAADEIIIGAPMWNFGIPSSLKAWIDHVVRAGRTFQYGANGIESMIPPGKHVIIASSRGGIYTEGPFKAMDYQETYLKAVLEFIGFKHIAFVRAEGTSMGENAIEKALHKADAQVAEATKRIV